MLSLFIYVDFFLKARVFGKKQIDPISTSKQCSKDQQAWKTIADSLRTWKTGNLLKGSLFEKFKLCVP
ncbi:MAG TPA: hypothetical protein DIT94_16775 [Deltaproteobacteria bacterium]|nr:hypothetical protein [Deltaproteobacteria bacterium]MBP44286.1 hypothetical protein [Deltaproteobacteria bacterium]HCP36051.1 hypothetical protein [Deltaproteobacteria bacterium]